MTALNQGSYPHHHKRF